MAANKLKSLQELFTTEAEAYKSVQKDVAKNHQARQVFLQQKNENDMVLHELDLLDEEANVFKLIGPCLIKQDPVEAKSNVNKRLEFINSELSRLDSNLKTLEDKEGRKQQQLAKLQQEIQQLQQGSSKAAET